MQAINPTERISQRADEILAAHQQAIYCRTDRMFAILMAVQFVAGVIAALLISPHTWAGSTSHVHIHVWAALFIGGIISALPISLAITLPGRFVTRCVIASTQMLSAGLLIHLSGGRIETHFHIFGSLAFLAFYRDWRVFIPATLVVALDHLIRGVYWPESVYGILSSTPWRSLEHAAWVLFEDIFLVYSCVQNVREMREIARNRAALEETNNVIAVEVKRQTAELTQQSQALRQEVSDRIAAEAEREKLHRQLMEVSHEAGMAEVATSVLHNVGNVLNSVNVSATLAVDQLRRSEVSGLLKLRDLLKGETDPHAFLAHDERGKLVPGFIIELADHLNHERDHTLTELQSLSHHVEHIKQIVDAQQSFAGKAGVEEELDVAEVLETALAVSQAALSRHSVSIVREFEDIPRVRTDRHKLLQILVNLITNAKHALADNTADNRRLTLRLGRYEEDATRLRIEVIDNGSGIANENLNRIFSYGFTTRKDGHGFGLHSAAVTAKTMGAELSVLSDGPGLGAAFTLKLPLQTVALGAI